MTRIIIETEMPHVVLKQLISEDTLPYFYAVNTSRDHLSQYGDATAKKYNTWQAVQESIVSPVNPSKLRFGIWHGRVFVGMVGLIPKKSGVCELGGWTTGSLCKRGYASVSRKALANWALSTGGFSEVYANIHPDNVASQRMVQKAGYRFDRHTSKGMRFVFQPKVTTRGD